MKLRFAGLFIITICALSIATLAQDETPTKVTAQNRAGDLPFSTYVGTQIEHVDVGSAALNITIPLIKIPGRGMNSELALRWNSNFYTMAPRINGQGSAYYIWNFELGSGWQTNTTNHTAAFQMLSCTLPVTGKWDADTNYIYTDPGGSKHPIMVQKEWGTGQTCAGPGNPANPDLTGQGMWAITDGISGSWSTVTNADGSVEDLKDSNGNQESNESDIDTLGRTPWSIQTTKDGNGNVTQQTYSYTDSGGTLQTYTVKWQLTPINTSFAASSCWAGTAHEILGSTRNVITTIILPNQQQYAFKYDSSYGEINEIDLPSGGVITYQWGTLQFCRLTRRYVTSRTETVNGVQSTWNFAVTPPYPTYSDTVTYPPVGTPPVRNQSVFVSGAPGTAGDGAITDAKIYAGSVQGTPLREYVIGYTTDHDPHADETCYSLDFPNPDDATNIEAVGQRVTSITTILEDGQKQKQTQFDYETFTYSYYYNHCDTPTPNNQSQQYTTSRGNVTEIREYDWGQGAHGALLRRTDKTYLHNSNSTYITYNIVSKVLQDTVYDATTNTCAGQPQPCAQTQYEYDNYVSGVNALINTNVPPNAAPQHNYTNYPSTFIYRGNVTRIKLYPSTASGATPLTTIYTYDDLGNVRAVQDPALNTTTYSYLDNWSGSSCPVPTGYNGQAYLTLVTDAKGYQAKRTLYQCTGLLQAHQDQNDLNAVRTGELFSYDWGQRLTQKQDTHLSTDTSWGTTSNTYNDVPPVTVTTSTAITSTVNKTTVSTKDGLGREINGQLTTDPDGTTETDTGYDALSRAVTVSNPYRPGQTLPTDGTTTTAYDPLSRIKSVAEPDGSSVSTTYSGNCTTVTEEAGKARQSCSDGVGRLTKVVEDPGTSPHLNYETDYAYDALGNLLCAVQKGTDTTSFTNCASAPATWRPRSFTYDAMSRLTSAANPESGTVTYVYDLNSNLSSKTAPKPNPNSTGTVTTNYSYDVLNRLTQKSYVNLTTPTAQYAYDGNTLTGCTVAPPSISSPTNLVGKRSAMCAGLSASKWSYDPMGREIVEKRTNQGSSNKTQTVQYLYNLDGSLKTLAYPSGKVLNYTIGGAGRVTQIDDTLDIYAASIAYTPNGSVAGGVQGPAAITNAYNDRLQPILLSAALSGQSSFFSLCYDFHLHVAINTSPCNFSAYTSGDNGNVFQVLNNVDSTRSAVYAYDALNRVAQANTITTTGSNCWGEVYTIDSWGNLTNRAGVSGMGSCSTEGLSATATTKNQLSGNGAQYDAAGNITNDGIGNMPTYDAENRIVTDAGFTYSYDADGTRMEKSTGSSGTMYWPGPSGTLAETNLTGTINEEYIYFNGERIARVDRPSGTVHYYFSNHLGSHTMVTSAGGSCEQDIDYYPYGGAVRDHCPTVAQHYKFTGKERDAESGLDMFGARYYASSMGRFMTPDWSASSNPDPVPYADLRNPQSLNLYGYVKNNPTTLTDPNGHCTKGGKEKSGWWCFWNYSDQDEKRDADQARANLAGTKNITINGQTVQDFLKGATNQQVLIAQRSILEFLTAEATNPCGRGVSCGIVFPVDFPTKGTVNWSASFESEGEARAFARTKLGSDAVEVEAGKWRSVDGKWQYRAKPGDVSENHIHLEQLNPQTGEVIQNLHLRWPEGSGR